MATLRDSISGSHIRLANPDSEGKGEAQLKGRAIMMGYLKNDEATTKAVQSDGCVGSGDQGRINDTWM